MFQLTYNLLKAIHQARKNFSKAEKYSLGESLEESCLDLLQRIIEAGQTKREWKIAAIEAALLGTAKTKILIRLAWDLKQIPESMMIAWQDTVQTIGRQLGGWRRSI